MKWKIPTRCPCGKAMPRMTASEQRKLIRLWEEHLDYVKRTGECGKVGKPHDHEECAAKGPVLWCERCAEMLQAQGLTIREQTDA